MGLCTLALLVVLHFVFKFHVSVLIFLKLKSMPVCFRVPAQLPASTADCTSDQVSPQPMGSLKTTCFTLDGLH